MGRIEEDIRAGAFQRVYLLYGEEGYLRRFYRMQLQKALIGPEDSMNLTRFDGKETSVKELIAQADTMPFFAPYRLIVVEESGLFRSAQEELCDYLPHIPAETVLVFSESEVDRRGKLYKTVKSVGCPVECARLKPPALTNWALKRLAREGRRIQRGAMDLLLRSAGDDMYALSNELEKVLSYTQGREAILTEDVEAVCPPRPENHIFRMIDATAQGRKDEALRLYYDLLALRESPLGILALLSMQLGRVLQVKDLRDQGFDQTEIAERSGLREFAVSSCLRSAQHFTARRIREAVEECVRTDERIKTGQIQDRIGVELAIIRIASGEAPDDKNRASA